MWSFKASTMFFFSYFFLQTWLTNFLHVSTLNIWIYRGNILRYQKFNEIENIIYSAFYCCCKLFQFVLYIYYNIYIFYIAVSIKLHKKDWAIKMHGKCDIFPFKILFFCSRCKFLGKTIMLIQLMGIVKNAKTQHFSIFFLSLAFLVTLQQ
jgi:hypothetical protein